MSEIFLTIVNMSISASWLVLAVLVLRLILKKAPKWVNVLLWGFVAFRLVCPVSFESMLSLIPSAETISPQIMTDPAPQITTGITALNGVINPMISDSFTPSPGASANPLQIWIPVVTAVWVAGIALMLIYTAVSYFLLRRKVDTAVRLRNNIFQSENVDSPFVLGILKPTIYLPFQMDSGNLEYVIAHEEAHIRRKDHWWKPFGFVLLAVHWFNPLMWVGYVLLCRDIELACDEKVIKELDNDNRANYTQALVACSINRRSIAACPLAFGEVGVKERVKSVMNYKKPGFWIMVAAVVICIVVAVCFLTNPMDTLVFLKEGTPVRYADSYWNMNAVVSETGNAYIRGGLLFEEYTYGIPDVEEYNAQFQSLNVSKTDRFVQIYDKEDASSIALSNNGGVIITQNNEVFVFCEMENYRFPKFLCEDAVAAKLEGNRVYLLNSEGNFSYIDLDAPTDRTMVLEGIKSFYITDQDHSIWVLNDQHDLWVYAQEYLSDAPVRCYRNVSCFDVIATTSYSEPEPHYQIGVLSLDGVAHYYDGWGLPMVDTTDSYEHIPVVQGVDISLYKDGFIVLDCNGNAVFYGEGLFDDWSTGKIVAKNVCKMNADVLSVNFITHDGCHLYVGSLPSSLTVGLDELE